MEALAKQYISEEEFWVLEERPEIKHEYFNGEIFAIAGGSHRHARIGSNALIVLGRLLDGRSCSPINGDQAVKIENSGLITYPDVSVYCEPVSFEGAGDRALLNPVVIIEVLSPSTAAYDRGEKFRHYQQIESLRDYILNEQDQVVVQHFHRLENNDWLLRTFSSLDDELTLESIDCTLSVRALYDKVEVPDGPPRLRLSEE